MSLRFVLVTLLDQEPNTGYGLGRILHQELSHVWDARLQQIYAELARLEESGLVVAEAIQVPNRPAKKVYSLTALGEHALSDWLLRRPTRPAPRDELLVKLYGSSRIPGELLARRLQERRDECEAELRVVRQRLQQASQAAGGRELGALLTLDAAACVLEAQLAWCERTLSLIDGQRTLRSVPRALTSDRGVRAARS